MKQELINNRLDGLASLIGNTPLLEISYRHEGQPGVVYAKAEHLNMTGSIKDRMACHILSRAYESGELKPGDTIVEATSGNTGIAFSAIGRALGHPVVIFIPNWMSAERINLIKSLGAETRLVSREDGGFLGSIEQAERYASSLPNTFLPRQFSNRHNTDAHYNTTGKEIWWQMAYRNIMPDAFVAGVGTGGTIMGAGAYLKDQNSKIKLHPLEPSNSPTMTTGHKVGHHRIQGISDEFIPQIVCLDALDDIIAVDDGDSIIMAQKLATELGIGVGISSGANFLGAVMIQNQMGPDARVVTIFSDDNKKYLSTDLLKKEPVKEGFISTAIELVSVKAMKRVCYTCCTPENCVESSSANVVANSLPYCPRRSQVCTTGM